jgi:two-component system response regulator RpfG
MAAILVVDDQPVSLMILRQLVSLIDKAHTIHAFTSPREALSWTASNPVDLVLTDYQMPDMNGIEFIRELRSNGRAGVPVVMVSANDDHGIREAARQAGVTEFLAKPVDHTHCHELCRGLLAGT